MKAAVLCFGSEVMEEDRVCLDIFEELKDSVRNVEFVACGLPNEILKYMDYDRVFILDVVRGIGDVTIIKDIGMLKDRKISTAHDFDLGFFITLLNKVRDMKHFEIIGVPFGMDKLSAKARVKKLLDEL